MIGIGNEIDLRIFHSVTTTKTITHPPADYNMCDKKASMLAMTEIWAGLKTD